MHACDAILLMYMTILLKYCMRRCVQLLTDGVFRDIECIFFFLAITNSSSYNSRLPNLNKREKSDIHALSIY